MEGSKGRMGRVSVRWSVVRGGLPEKGPSGKTGGSEKLCAHLGKTMPGRGTTCATVLRQDCSHHA